MPQVVDSHAHIYPDYLGRIPLNPSWTEKVQNIRRKAREALGFTAQVLHEAQTRLRAFDPQIRSRLDQIGGAISVPRLALESTSKDLFEEMDSLGVDQAIVIAHPPICSNAYVMDEAKKNPRIIPVVSIPPSDEASGDSAATELTRLFTEGARALKFHPAIDGLGPDSRHYLKLLDVARTHHRPVIIHTGCLHLKPFFKDPERSEAGHFAEWFEEFKDVRFVLAHMNYHSPRRAIELAERYPNVLLETSWQPTEVIEEAIRNVGAKKVMFGSDWPVMGNNLKVALGRAKEALERLGASDAEAAAVLGGNALDLVSH